MDENLMILYYFDTFIDCTKLHKGRIYYRTVVYDKSTKEIGNLSEFDETTNLMSIQ